MRLRLKQCVAMLALYAVALHVILFAFVPVGTGATVDPLSVICHAGSAIPENTQPTDLLPGHACDHCNLCSAATPPAPGVALIDNLMPAQLLQVLRPASESPGTGVTFSPNLARGPPPFV